MTRLLTDMTKVTKAKPGTVSVRTIIPSYIAKRLNLTDGDALE